MSYTKEQVVRDLEDIARGKGYYRVALCVAHSLRALTEDDRWVIRRWLNGRQSRTDWGKLQTIAAKINPSTNW